MRNFLGSRCWSLLALLIGSTLVGCGTSDGGHETLLYESNLPKTPTTRIQYEREGGGQKLFEIADSTSYYDVSITRYGFRDTAIALRIPKDSVALAAESTLVGLFAGTIGIAGRIYGTDAPTGTWNYVYILHDGGWVRVGNDSVVEELIPFEVLVERYLQQPR